MSKQHNFKKNHVSLLKFKSKLYKFNQLQFGYYGLQAIESGILTLKQVEATRRIFSRALKRKSKIWIKTNFIISTTAKPTAIRMGKGKGATNQLIAFVRRGDVLFETGFTTNEAIKSVFASAKKKLPVLTKLVKKEI